MAVIESLDGLEEAKSEAQAWGWTSLNDGLEEAECEQPLDKRQYKLFFTDSP